jgi:hypothetical protein
MEKDRAVASIILLKSQDSGLHRVRALMARQRFFAVQDCTLALIYLFRRKWFRMYTKLVMLHIGGFGNGSTIKTVFKKLNKCVTFAIISFHSFYMIED